MDRGQLLLVELHEIVEPPPVAVAVYPVIGLPPLELGVAQAMLKEFFELAYVYGFVGGLGKVGVSAEEINEFGEDPS